MKDLLIIEDEKEILNFLADFFEEYEISLASSHCEAIGHLSSDRFKLVICDFQLFKSPCCNLKTGLDVFNFMKENNITTPYILYSGASHIDLDDFSGGNFIKLVDKTNQALLFEDSLEILKKAA